MSDMMDADSLCIGCVRRFRTCPIEPVEKVTDCVEYHPTDTQAAFERSLKEHPCLTPPNGWMITGSVASMMKT